MAKLLEGKLLAEKIKASLKTEVEAIKNKTARPLVLSSIEIGEDEGTKIYTRIQEKTASSLGIEYQLNKLEKNITQEELIKFILGLNQNESLNGIILHQPLPPQIDDKKIIQFIAVDKDVEGLHPQNLGKILLGTAKIVPCTAAAVMELIKSSGIDLYGGNACIIGRSEIVGKPLIFLLLDKSSTVTVCHSGTSKAGKLKDYVSNADILVAAVGKANFIPGSWVKEGAVVIDVGINRVGDKLIGDIEFAEAEKRAAFISPVPGGVGPLTAVMLMRNLIEAAKLQQPLSLDQ